MVHHFHNLHKSIQSNHIGFDINKILQNFGLALVIPLFLTKLQMFHIYNNIFLITNFISTQHKEQTVVATELRNVKFVEDFTSSLLWEISINLFLA